MIKSADRDVLRRQVEITHDAAGWRFACSVCPFRRDYGTEQGAVNGVAAHVRQHGLRVELERTQARKRLDEFMSRRVL